MNGDNGVVRRSIAQELGLKVKSCDYGNDSSVYGFGPAMASFVEMLEEKYGDVYYFEDVLGFILRLMFEVDGKKCIYNIGAGNNGQEVTLSMYLEDIATLDSNEFKKILCDLDEEIRGYADKAELDKY